MSRLLPLKGDSGTGALDQMIVAENFSTHFDHHRVDTSMACCTASLNAMTEAVEREFGSAGGMLGAEGRYFPLDQAVRRCRRPQAGQTCR